MIGLVFIYKKLNFLIMNNQNQVLDNIDFIAQFFSIFGLVFLILVFGMIVCTILILIDSYLKNKRIIIDIAITSNIISIILYFALYLSFANFFGFNSYLQKLLDIFRNNFNVFAKIEYVQNLINQIHLSSFNNNLILLFVTLSMAFTIVSLYLLIYRNFSYEIHLIKRKE